MDLDDEELKVTRMMNGADRNSKVRVKNDIEVNEYVRTKNGIIGKVIKVLSNRVFLDNLGYAILIRDIVKHSKQLIDLIEVGDIVEIRTGLYSSFKYFVENEDNLLLLENWNIETILTKESYMANCYKVGGEDE